MTTITFISFIFIAAALTAAAEMMFPERKKRHTKEDMSYDMFVTDEGRLIDLIEEYANDNK